MAGCTNELYNLIPTVGTCPASNELVLFLNVGGVTGGYAARPWSLVRQCLLSQGLNFVPLQFTIGQPGSPLTAGETSFTITQTGIIEDSVIFILSGLVLGRNDSSQISYTIAYNSPSAGQMTITLNQDAQTDDTYILIYSYAD